MVDPKVRTGAPQSRPKAADPASRSTTPQRDDAGGSVPAAQPARNPPYESLKMPHERDESAERDTSAHRDANGTRPIIRQGAQDLASGQQDTDCYNAAAKRDAHKSTKPP